MRQSKAVGALYKVFILTLIVIVMLAMVEYDFSPRLVYKNARVAARSLYSQLRFYYNFHTADEMHDKYVYLWYPASHKATGVTRYNRDKSYEGLTFFSNQETKAFLMDNNGNVIHEWGLPFGEVWPEPRHARMFEPDKLVYWRHAWLFPNGDVLAIYEGSFQTPYGVGMAKVNKDSELIWKSEVNGHHDMDIDEDGNIYVLKHDYVRNEQTRLPFIRDGIAVLSPEGSTLMEVDLYQKLLDSGFGNILDLEYDDPMHANNLELLDEGIAGKFPMFNKGDILISLRNPDAVFVLDGKTFEPKWDMQGVSVMQHDPDFLDNGMIRIFDNQGNRGKPGGVSRLIDIDPSSNSIVWEYTGTEQEPFATLMRGSQQQLPGGNVLITESNNGRLFEITSEGEVVWEYVSQSYDGTSIGPLNWAIRYNKKVLPFLDQ